MAKVKLIRPLDGQAIGSIVEYPDDDAKRLADAGVVSLVKTKAAAVPANKAAPEPENKAAPQRNRKAR